MQTTEITNEVIKNFLEGRDPQERIVNLDYNYQNDYVTVYYRDENDVRHHEKQPYYPFLWATRKACLNLCNGDRTKIRELLLKYGISCVKLKSTGLDGIEPQSITDGYLFMFKATKPMSYSHFLDFFKKANNPVYSKDENSTSKSSQYLAVPPQEQFLISTGKRFFKGYDDYNDILRMIFDLETEGLDPKKHRIEWYGISFARPFNYNGKTVECTREFQLTGTTEEEKDASELNLIDTAFKIISAFKPDVITAHNGENFDWNFIIERCKQLGSSIEEMSSKYFNGQSIGKNQKESVLKLGGEVEHFYRTIVPGTIITDSLHAVRRAQATDSNFKEANLKYATKYLDLVSPNRVYIPGNRITEISNDYSKRYAFNNKNGDWYIYDPNYIALSNEKKNNNGYISGGTIEKNEEKTVDGKFILHTRNELRDGYELVDGHYIVERYLADDLYEAERVEYSLIGVEFSLCKIMPVPFQKVVTMGTAGQWKAIMMAWSYENGLAIPKPENAKMSTGGLSRLLSVGYIGTKAEKDENGKFKKTIAKLDFNSLYPSIILTWGISDNSDLMGATLKMLEYVLTTRETHKKLKKEAEKNKNKFEEKINSGEVLSEEEQKEYYRQCNIFKVEDNAQACVKKLGNSFFGSLSSVSGAVYPWKSLTCGERTTCTGRQSLRLMISHFSEMSKHYNLSKDYDYIPIVGDTDGFNLKLPSKYRYTIDNPYISNGTSRVTKKGQAYYGIDADVAEFNDMYLSTDYFKESKCMKMGLDIDECLTSSINISRKNYCDFFPEKPYPDDIKIVGNSLKSKKLQNYIEEFMKQGLRYLLQGEGQKFLDEYYSYVDRIYNYRIPLRDIASKGKVKKSLKEYVDDCNTITKAGRPKSRQAWMELALRNNVKVDIGETIYYINVGKTKSQADVKKVTHYFIIQEDGSKKDVVTQIEKEYKKYKSECKENKVDILDKDVYISKEFPNVIKEEEIVLNAVLLPREVVESEDSFYCKDGEEYNVPKYIEMFNKRITPLLVCFKKEIRDKILITNPSDRPYFTQEESELCSGEPNKASDQDTYEQLMTMEDKEIRFWRAHPEFEIPFLKECGMNWDEIVKDYDERMAKEKELGIDAVRSKYEEIISNLSNEEIDNLYEGELPASLLKIIDIDPTTGLFVDKNYKDIVIGSLSDIFESEENNEDIE